MDSAAWPAAQPSASDYAQRRGSAPADLADLARAGKYPGYDQQPRASHGAYESPRYDDPQQYARAPAQQQQQQQGMLYGYDQRFVRPPEKPRPRTPPRLFRLYTRGAAGSGGTRSGGRPGETRPFPALDAAA